MRRGQLERPLPADGYPEDGVTLRRIIRDGERDVEFSYTDEREPGEGDYYYVRVRQVNDAWPGRARSGWAVTLRADGDVAETLTSRMEGFAGEVLTSS